MFSALKKIFSNSPAEPSEEQKQRRLQMAASVLMLEVSKADNSIDDVEIEQVRSILSSSFGLDDETIDSVVSESHVKSDDATSLYEFTREINDNCDHDERMNILSHLWEISLVDEHVDSHERHFIRKIAGLMYLTDQDIIKARSMAQNALLS